MYRILHSLKTTSGFSQVIIVSALFVAIAAFVFGTKIVLQQKIPQLKNQEVHGFVLSEFMTLKAKAKEYEEKGATVSGVLEKLPDVLSLIKDNRFTEASTQIASLSAQLDQNLAQKVEANKIASESAAKKAEEERKKAEAAQKATPTRAPTPKPVIATAAPQAVTTAPGSGYSRINVPTERGTFSVDVLTADISSTRVLTDAGVTGNCDNNCGTASLSDYVGRNGGYGGMNGTYFCPPDYSGCAGKTNTFHWFVFNTQSRTFINADKRHWDNAGSLFVFRSGSMQFFRNPDSFGLDTNITGAIASHPTLMADGQVVLTDAMMDDKQRTTKGNRGGMGNKGNTIYLIIARSATVTDLAYIMKALGIENGINLDGGGSSAMHYGGYKVGPGRSLPNAIILAR